MPWRGPEVEGEFPTLGHIAAEWCEENLLIPDGPHLGEPFRFYDEQLNFVLWTYRLDPDATGDAGADAHAYGGSMLVRGQKWGKDPIMAALSLFHAFGPCEFGGWDANGEPVGVPHPSPWVAVAATNDEQTDNTWLPIVQMAKTGYPANVPGAQIHDTYIQLPCGNPIEPLTTTAWGRLGGRFTFVTITESGILVGDGRRGGLTFARTLKRNVAGMNGRWISATNAWDPTEHSDAQETYAAKDPFVHIDAKLARKHIDLGDTAALREEIRYLYGDSLRSNGGHVSEQRIERDVTNKANGEAEVRRFYLSEIIAGQRTAVDPARWAALARDDDRLEPGEPITLGFDGSRSRDATVLTACRISDGRLFHLRTWVPADHPDHKVPRPEVDQAVRDAFSTYEVWYLYADPYRWQDYLDLWAGDYVNRVVEFPTNVERRMDAALGRFLDAIKTGELTHSGEATLTEHAENAALKKGKRRPPREGDDGLAVEYYLSVTKKRDGLLIDAFVSAVLSYEARGKAIEDGALVEEPELEPFFLVGG